MSTISKTLIIVGVLATLAGIVFVALDLFHMGDNQGLDLKDIGIVIIGIILIIVGNVTSSRKSVVSVRSQQQTGN